MTPSSQTQVLIVGAGPTGLAAAATLGRLGVQVRIIEKIPERSTQSKALGVQAGTMECLEQVFGAALPEQMAAAGVRVQKAKFNIEGRPPLAIDLSLIPSRYNFVLTLPQSETERFLEETMNSFSIRAERSTELTEAEDRGLSVLSKIRKADGTVEEILSDFVLGCDGAHSSIRHQAGIDFVGEPYEGNFILGDVQVRWPLPDGQMHIFVGKKGVTAGFPLPEENHFRFIVVSKNPPPSDSLDISLEDFTRELEAVCPVPVKITKAFWLSRFRVHHRRAGRFQKGRLFLLGDAAHIHSPIGGQGMNTGIQDAVNLGYKIAGVLKKGVDPSLLKKYEEERLPVARSIVSTTDKGTRLILLGESPWLRKLVFLVLPWAAKSRWMQTKMAALISQVETARKEIKNREAWGGWGTDA